MRVRHVWLALLIALFLFALTYAYGAEPTKRLPPETPKTATAVMCFVAGQDAKHVELVLVVLTYPHGELLRITAENIHDYFPTVLDLFRYSAKADDPVRYDVACAPGLTVT